MALKVGDLAPDFTLPSTTGSDFNLRRHAADQPVVLYFYPKDFTSVCTREACEFRDTFSFLRNLDIQVIGISRDDVATHRRFQQANHLPFALLADVDGKVAELYRATLPFVRFTRRITYLLNQQHTVVAAYENLFAATSHIRTVVEKVRGLTS